MRLDVYVAQAQNISRSGAAKLIENSCVSIDGKVVTKPSHNVNDECDIKIVDLPKQEKIQNILEPTIIYEDDYLAVINKPAGLVVHDGASVKETTLVDWLQKNGFKLAQNTGEDRQGIVHRLDKETSGLLVVAKTNEAADGLKEQLCNKTMGRYYIALITPVLKDVKIIDAPLARHPKNRLRRAVVEGGKEAKTMFVPIKSTDKVSLIAAKLFTGRTHQIRAHLAHFARHILADTLYGFKSLYITIPKITLHAGYIRFNHPILHKNMEFCVPVTQEFRNTYKEIFNEEIMDTDLLPGYFDGVL